MRGLVWLYIGITLGRVAESVGGWGELLMGLL